MKNITHNEFGIIIILFPLSICHCNMDSVIVLEQYNGCQDNNVMYKPGDRPTLRQH